MCLINHSVFDIGISPLTHRLLFKQAFGKKYFGDTDNYIHIYMVKIQWVVWVYYTKEHTFQDKEEWESWGSMANHWVGFRSKAGLPRPRMD